MGNCRERQYEDEKGASKAKYAKQKKRSALLKKKRSVLNYMLNDKGKMGNT